MKERYAHDYVPSDRDVKLTENGLVLGLCLLPVSGVVWIFLPMLIAHLMRHAHEKFGLFW